jgi:hypothetical protein
MDIQIHVRQSRRMRYHLQIAESDKREINTIEGEEENRCVVQMIEQDSHRYLRKIIRE